MAIHQEFVEPLEEPAETTRTSIREDFPTVKEAYMGGDSDGYEYKTTFAGSNLKHSYTMIKAFLEEQGYGEIPIPKDEEELKLFRLQTRNKQILLFEDNGYVHNPIKILFPPNRRNKRTLTLCIYNEADPEHLLKFHRKGPYEK